MSKSTLAQPHRKASAVARITGLITEIIASLISRIEFVILIGNTLCRSIAARIFVDIHITIPP
jgi:hypothetical protein